MQDLLLADILIRDPDLTSFFVKTLILQYSLIVLDRAFVSALRQSPEYLDSQFLRE